MQRTGLLVFTFSSLFLSLCSSAQSKEDTCCRHFSKFRLQTFGFTGGLSYPNSSLYRVNPDVKGSGWQLGSEIFLRGGVVQGEEEVAFRRKIYLGAGLFYGRQNVSSFDKTVPVFSTRRISLLQESLDILPSLGGRVGINAKTKVPSLYLGYQAGPVFSFIFTEVSGYFQEQRGQLSLAGKN